VTPGRKASKAPYAWERIHGVTSIHVPAPEQAVGARDYGRTDADLMTWQRKMKRVQAGLYTS
jgi:hypothetical protein